MNRLLPEKQEENQSANIYGEIWFAAGKERPAAITIKNNCGEFTEIELYYVLYKKTSKKMQNRKRGRLCIMQD